MEEWNQIKARFPEQGTWTYRTLNLWHNFFNITRFSQSHFGFPSDLFLRLCSFIIFTATVFGIGIYNHSMCQWWCGMAGVKQWKISEMWANKMLRVRVKYDSPMLMAAQKRWHSYEIFIKMKAKWETSPELHDELCNSDRWHGLSDGCRVLLNEKMCTTIICAFLNIPFMDKSCGLLTITPTKLEVHNCTGSLCML